MVETAVLSILRVTLDQSQPRDTPATPPNPPATPPEQITLPTDEPFDSALWADADDDRLGGYRRGSSQ
jgi:hypothetical protein